MSDLAVSATPPAAFNLVWSDLGSRTTSEGPRRLFQARSTPAFDAAWIGGRRGELRGMGYASKKGDSGWMAQFWARPSAADEAARAAATAQAVAASRATDADVEIPAPEGRTYLPYQRAGIAYCMSRPAALIGDEMGLGKTIQAVGVLNAGHAKRVLVCCPASLKLNWKRELGAWLVEQLPVHVVDGGKRPFPEVGEAGVVVINYDVMHSYQDQIRAVSWDLLVCDEAHLLKSKTARRTRAVFGGPAKGKSPAVTPIAAARRLLLTGTPMSNRPVELHPLLAFLDKASWGDFFAFAKRYCAAHQTRFGWDFEGSSHLDELQEKLRASVMVRRLKADVLTELPPKLRQVVPLEAGSASLRKLLKSEQAAYDAWEALKAAGDASTAAAFAELSRLREEVGLAKAPLIAEHILRDEGPVVAFAQHRSVVDAVTKLLRAEGRRVAVITGDMPTEHRQSRVDMFQNGPSDVILGTLGAMGVGHTLTRSAHVIIGELDWVPASMSQAEDRCHRIGQHGSVHVEHLVFEGSLDSRLVEVVVGKQAVLDAALDAVPTPVEAVPAFQDTTEAPATALSLDEVASAVDDVLRDIEAEEAARRAARDASDAEVRGKLQAALAAAGWGLDADDHARAEALVAATAWAYGDRTEAQVLVDRLRGYVDRAADRVAAAAVLPDDAALVADPEVREVVLAGCKHLSSLDADRARDQNGVGWSKTTSWDGHWLAGQDALDEQSAAVGLGLLRHHQRQLDADMQARLFGDVRAARAPLEFADAKVCGALRDLARDEALSAADQSAAFLLRCRDVWTPEERERALAIVERASAPIEVIPPLDSEPDDAVPVPEVPEPVVALEVEPEAAHVVESEPVEEAAEPTRSARSPKAESAENVAARARLVAVGEAMYGPRWMTDLARDLKVNDRTMRRYDTGSTPIPADLWEKIAAVARRRRDALDAVIAGLGAP